MVFLKKKKAGRYIERRFHRIEMRNNKIKFELLTMTIRIQYMTFSA